MEEVPVTNPYFIGSLLWVKIGKHPYWPCMVSYDPKTGIYFKLARTNRSGEITYTHHVQYFGNCLQHGWTTGETLSFQGRSKFFIERDKELNAATAKQRKHIKRKYHVASSVMNDWLIAVEEAEKAMAYRVEDRHELFVFKYEFKLKKTAKVIGKKKKRRRTCYSKPVKKLPRKVISEATSIVEPLCFYCEKGNVDLFCTSGVCSLSFHKHCVGIIHAPDNFLCAHCSINNQQPCIVCKSYGWGTTKCSKCNNSLHDICLQRYKCADIKNFVCSAHVCLSCHARNPRSSQNSTGPFVTCFRCPTAYHDRINCLPVGCARLSPTVIVCPEHFWGKNKVSPQLSVNIDFCSACFEGGQLICCEACPHAYHAACINTEVPLGDFYCNDCTERKHFYIGMIVWVKSGFFRWWPAQILNPEDSPSNIKALYRYDGEFLIQFYGSDEYEWTHRGRVFPYDDLNKYMWASSKKENRPLWVKFKLGLEEAAEAYKEYNDPRLFKDSGTKPGNYRHIRINRAIPPAFIRNIPQSACSCSPSDEAPCGPDSYCLNRTMLYECHPDNCKAKDKCQNQRFQKRKYGPIKVFKSSYCGWGLKATKSIPKDAFIIEYVGEVITQKMYEQRVVKMRMMNVQNYYFLLLDQGRLIDAGPRGNLSRFINHSCDPNCVMEKWSVNGDLRIGIFALRDIMSEEELTFNYQSDSIGFGQECKCGASNCVGVIGLNGKKKQKIK